MSQQIFGNDLAVIRKSKLILTLNKPAYVGMCILDLSKVLMHDFHYDYIKNKYGNNSKLSFTDIDSLMYVFDDFSKDKEMFDFSIDSTELKYYDHSNKLVVGKMKDETGGVVVKEFVALI